MKEQQAARRTAGVLKMMKTFITVIPKREGPYVEAASWKESRKKSARTRRRGLRQPYVRDHPGRDGFAHRKMLPLAAGCRGIGSATGVA